MLLQKLRRRVLPLFTHGITAIGRHTQERHVHPPHALALHQRFDVQRPAAEMIGLIARKLRGKPRGDGSGQKHDLQPRTQRHMQPKKHRRQEMAG